MNLKSFKSLFCDPQGNADEARWGLWIGMLSLVGFAGWAVICNKQAFNAMDLGGALAALWAGVGAHISLRKDQ